MSAPTFSLDNFWMQSLKSGPKIVNWEYCMYSIVFRMHLLCLCEYRCQILVYSLGSTKGHPAILGNSLRGPQARQLLYIFQMLAVLITIVAQGSKITVLCANKPGPPRFAWSTILVISSPNFVKLTLKKFGLAIKITPTKETVAVVFRAESLFLEGCMIN